MKLRLDSNIRALTRGLDEGLRNQLPFATARALTAVARSAQKELTRSIEASFDRPTPWIKNSVFVQAATKAKLEAVVGIKNKGSRATPADYLREHILTGTRSNKPMEKAMRAMDVLPVGWLVVPSRSGVPRDAYGNVSRATVNRILRALAQKQTATRGGVSSRLFVIKPGQRSHLKPGIWSVSRAGDQQILKPVFLFVHAATYRMVFDMPRIVAEVVRKELRGEFERALAGALRTAR